ncbi:MAG TPA: hypothetical protein ENJ95_14000 [Bacteroidetes bacterium]|nr:hypothetical protein [Bacteroidota bacterium]
MMLRKISALSFIFCFFQIISFSQTSITGTVVDGATNDPLPFAYLKIEDIALGTVTEGDGKFKIDIPKKYDRKNIVFSYVGYEDLLFNVAELRNNNNAVIKMKTATNLLAEVIVKPRKLMKPKALLRKVISNIPKNYPSVPSLINGYYRETITENGAYIKYTDAACQYYSLPYTNKKHKWKEYQNSFNPFSGSLSTVFNFDRSSLHRVHFHHETLKDERVEIISSRSSLSLSRRGMHANIQGGPLSLFARDRAKYQKSFLGKHRFRGYDYKVDETQDENGNWIYVLSFHTKTTAAQLDALESKRNRRQWTLANKYKLLKGNIYIDKKTFAILRYECSVPNQLKKYFCGYKSMATKHFDYKLDISYKKSGDKYYIDHLRHEDEFIYKDTIDNTVTPYAAVSEFWVSAIKKTGVKKPDESKNFANVDFNQLYDYALEYDSVFWKNYTKQNGRAIIGKNIRNDMEAEKTLEQQFRDKHLRDENMPAPVAKKEASSFKINGDVYRDDYAWLKDTRSPRSNKPVMEYLQKENDYAKNYFIPLRKKQRQIFDELSANIEKNYTSLPVKKDGYFYFLKYTEDQEYPVYYRQKTNKSKPADILLDVNKMAKQHDYYFAGGIQVSPGDHIMSYYENTTGKDDYVLKFKNLKKGTALQDSLTGIGGMVWANDSTLFYVELEKKTFRSYKIKKHILNTNSKKDRLIYEEKDPAFSVDINKSKSKEYIFINTASSTSSEVRYLKTNNLKNEFKLIKPRKPHRIYSVSHFKNKLYILTNEDAINFKIMTVDTSDISAKNWQPYIPHKAGVLINNFVLFDKYTVVSEKENAQNRLKIIDNISKKSHYIDFKEKIYDVNIGYNPDTDTDTLQFSYTSYTTPSTVFNYHMGDRGRRQVKQEAKPRINLGKIKVKREWATARDGKKIPLTIIYNKWLSDGKKSEHKRVFLTSYGSYGAGQTPGFDHAIYALLNRGFVYAVAHVRGGNDMGMEWYEDGKLLNKKNTFYDFISCAEYLIEKGYAQKGSITAQGGSAGGLLMGAVANMRPDLFKTIILDVPFVDVINTMLDDKLPLTVGEYEEWGNPNKKKYYEYIKSYSPYDNVKTQAYPNMLFFTGLNDTRVGYWEPAKMAAKLRATKTDDNLLILKTGLFSGHGGNSGRYAYYKDLSYKYALIFDLYDEE